MDTHGEQVDIEGGNDFKAESGEYVNIGGNEGEDIDGQGRDGDDDVRVKGDINVDRGLNIYSSLCVM